MATQKTLNVVWEEELSTAEGSVAEGTTVCFSECERCEFSVRGMGGSNHPNDECSIPVVFMLYHHIIHIIRNVAQLL